MKTKAFQDNKLVIAYIVGVALGDGNLSKLNNRSVRLRVTCDLKYPFLIEKIKNSIQIIFPHNKVSLVKRKQRCLDISCYSNSWETILGWKASGGSKFKQNTAIPEWIKRNREYLINCLRGLIETDGAVYQDRGYKMVVFKSIVYNLAIDFYEAVKSLGFGPRIYKIEPKSEFNVQTAYHVRLSKDVSAFLDLIQPEKR